VSTFVEPIVIDQIGIRPLGPTARGLIEFIRKGAYGYRDGDPFGGEKASLLSQYRRAEETAVFVTQ
jgi:hypothetical protein